MNHIRLERVQILGFGRLRGLEVSFAPGLNLIWGPNEAGKSTLQRFLRAMLFGMKKPGVNRYSPDLERFRPWEGEGYGGTLWLRVANRTYRIERFFSHNREGVAIYDDLTGEDLTSTFPQDGRREYLIAETLLGITPVIFDNTICIKQLESATETALATEVNSRLANLSQSREVEVSVQKALQALKKALDELGTTRGVKTHLLGQTAERVRVLEEEAAEVAALYQEVLDDTALLSLRQQEIAELEKKQLSLKKAQAAFELKAVRERLRTLQQVQEQIGLLQKELAAVEERKTFPIQLRDELQRLTARLEELSRREEKIRLDIADCQRRISLLQAFLAETGSGEVLGPEVIHQATQIASNLKVLASSLDHLAKEKEELTRQLTGGGTPGASPVRWPVVFWATLILLLSTMVSTAEQIIPALARGDFLSVMGPVGMVVTVIILFFAWTLVEWREASKTNRHRQELETRLQECQQRLEEQKVQYQSSLALLKNLYARAKMELDLDDPAGDETLSRFLEVVNTLQEKKAELRNEENLLAEKQDELKHLLFQRQSLQAQRDAILKQAGVSSVAAFEAACQDYETWQNLSQRRAVAQERLRAILQGEDEKALWQGEAELAKEAGDAVVPEEDPAPLLKETAAALQQKREEMVRLQSRLETILQGSRPLAEIEHDLAEARAHLSELLAYQAALELARETITEEAEKIQREFTPALNRAVSQALSRITKGRYQEVRVSPDLALSVVEPGNGRLVPIQSLSLGTMDQVYLALRLAVADLLSGNELRLPLLLDDSFVQYDDQRLEAVLELLEEESHERQILLFTCHQRERKLLQKICAGRVHELTLALSSAS